MLMWTPPQRVARGHAKLTAPRPPVLGPGSLRAPEGYSVNVPTADVSRPPGAPVQGG